MTTKDTIMEAIGLLRDAEQELTEAQSRLSSARGWGIYDLIARGGLISNFIKHRRIDQADECVDSAREKLLRVQRLLRGVPGVPPVFTQQLSGVLRFFDIGTHSLIASLLVQEKIADRRAQVEQMLAEVRALHHHLSSAR